MVMCGCGACVCLSKSDNTRKLIATSVIAISSVEEKFSHEYFLN